MTVQPLGARADAAPLRFFVDPAAVVWLGGEAPLDFLQRMSTNALVDLPVGEGRYTVLTSDAGRAIDLLACQRGRAGVALITTSPAAAASVAEHLRSFVLFGDKVTVTDASDQVGLVRLVGEGARSKALSLTGVAASPSRPGAWVESGEGEESLWVLRHLEPGLGGVDLVLPRGEPLDALIGRLRDAGIPAGGPSDLDRLRVLAGLPAFGAEIDGRTNPLELGLLDAIDFDKGCYVGQEVIARLANYEKVQQRLVRIRAERPLRADMTLLPADPGAGRRPRPGRVTTAAALAHGSSDEGLALADAALGSDRSGRWEALALVPLSTRVGDRFEIVDGDREQGGVDADGARVGERADPALEADGPATSGSEDGPVVAALIGTVPGAAVNPPR